jgi:hypothetical protein
MSRMSRSRRGKQNKQNKRSTGRSVRPEVVSPPDDCDCPSCSVDFDPQQLIDELIEAAEDQVGLDDPLYAEILGAAFVSIDAGGGAAFEEALLGGFIPALEARAATETLAILLAVGAVAGGRAGKEASGAADRLVEAGVPRPGWAAELGEPVMAGDCWRLVDSDDSMSVLACSFHRAGRSHAIVLSVDHADCGAADRILLLDADDLPEALEMMRASGPGSGVEVTAEQLDGAEFRWHVEKALDARAVHDGEAPDDEMDEMPFDEEEGPDYPALAVLVRARMNALPVPSKPAAPHEGEVGWVGPAALRMLADFAGNAVGSSGPGWTGAARGRTAVAALPAKRKKSGPPPVYQLKVSLRGTKPPIWRRLEVPADLSLARLHTVIQVAFGWDDSHMHVFETPYGRFGLADAELGQRAEAPVTLERVAPAAKSKLCYTYDFGDDWEHDIVVEKVLDRADAVVYPRCTGGRRAGPPDDCGGVWGYAELVEILGDPNHPEHEDRLEWLGLDDAAGFDPDRFDANAVTLALSLEGVKLRAPAE